MVLVGWVGIVDEVFTPDRETADDFTEGKKRSFMLNARTEPNHLKRDTKVMMRNRPFLLAKR
jgi:hypothetical protein